MGVQINGDTGNISATKADYSGNVTIGGTLTYEDVTNVDSIGIITARNGIEVGARPGVAASVSVDGNAIFSGIVTATSYRGDGSNLTGISADVVDDTSPQLGGNLDVNTKNIEFGDSGAATDDRLTFGAGTDLSMYHDGSDSFIKNTTGHLRIYGSGTDDKHIYLQPDDGDNGVIVVNSGAVMLYHNNTLQCETSANGLKFPSGKGIDFSATSDGSNATSTTTMSNELLDDYEEGTWTPFFYAWTGGGVPATHDVQSGTYTKIGNTVHITFDLKGDRGNMGGNYITMGGLPFAHLGSNGGWGSVPWTEYVGSENSTSSTRGHGLEFGGGATVHAWLTGYTGGAAGSNYTATYMGTNYMSNTNHTRIKGSATYFTTA